MLSLKNKKKLFTISVYSFLDCFLKKTFKYFYLSKVFHKFLSQFKCKFKNGFGIQFYIFFLQKTYKNLYFFLHLSILKKYLYLPFLLKKFGKSFKKTKRVLGQDTFFFIFSKFFFNFFSFHRNFYFLFSNTSKMFCNVSSNFFLNFLNYSIYLFFFFFKRQFRLFLFLMRRKFSSFFFAVDIFLIKFIGCNPFFFSKSLGICSLSFLSNYIHFLLNRIY
jgi:hypothetical protein